MKHFALCSLLIAVVLPFAGSVRAEDLQQIKPPILKTQQGHYSGWIQDKAGVKDPQFVHHPRYASVRNALHLQPTVDLRNSGLPSPYDQDQLGACTGNGWAFCYAFAHHRVTGQWQRFSRLFIYYGERNIEGTVPTDSGAEIRDGAQVVTTLGCCLENLWPYDISQFAAKPPPKAFAAALSLKALKCYKVDNTDHISIRVALAHHDPVVFGCSVYEDIENLTSSDYILPMPRGPPVGGHCMVVVGYKDPDKRYIVRNSWGTTWGQNGYCEVPYAYLEDGNQAGDFWVLSSAE
jgi:C1A family cysteine protease